MFLTADIFANKELKNLIRIMPNKSVPGNYLPIGYAAFYWKSQVRNDFPFTIFTESFPSLAVARN